PDLAAVTAHASSAFELLSPLVKRWVWNQGWTALRDVQEQAIAPILANRDVVISSATASGKTEAAFLPIVSALDASPHDSLAVLYVAPLKALINDQQRRLESLFAMIDEEVTPWHGDVPSARKQRLIANPSGALLITPESLEALFVIRGQGAQQLFRGLRYVVVDELHAFIGTERGRQMQSLLHRVELAAGKHVPRIALSATLGNLDLAAEFLRPREGDGVEQIVSNVYADELRLQLRGSRILPPEVGPAGARVAEASGRELQPEEFTDADELQIADHLYGVLRGGSHLVFANRRTDVERYADLLRRRSQRERVPNEFWPHHGSLSREIREDAEEILRSGRPATVIATTTLELGIDVGSIDSVAQIGPPSSVAALRQRLGRSGRRAGQASTLRIYVREESMDLESPLLDQLRIGIVQTVAAVRLLLEKWVEPPMANALHLSTLVQQTLSLIAQLGGFRADAAYRALCATGPFGSVPAPMFADFLRDLAAHDLIIQTHDGEIVLGLSGERLVNHYDFYAAFMSGDEWKLTTEGRLLGTLPITSPLAPDLFIVFAGQRWRIVAVDDDRHQVELVPSAGGRPPLFGGGGALVHERVRQEMLAVLGDEDEPTFLDPVARELLAEGRTTFRRLNLQREGVVEFNHDTYVFPWTGDREMHTLLLELRQRGFRVDTEGAALLLEGVSSVDVTDALSEVAEEGVSHPILLAGATSNLVVEKHHRFLSRPLLMADYASSRLDPLGAADALQRLIRS
ncbi:MAG: DEAD/DEAH box helicase, partial [Chloroflexi bacterium]|nr:DEAD/DEAH box helicase [Chloroflexota bacterium]